MTRTSAGSFAVTLTTGQTVTCSRETITPGMALQYLKANVKNRKPRKRQVEILKRDLLAGAWRFTHQGIAFAEDGSLLDGQHRLQAIVAAEKPVLDMLVWRHLPDTAKEATDQSQGRTLAENLQLLDGEKNSTSLCGLVNAVVRCWTHYDYRLSLPQTREVLTLLPYLRKVAAVDTKTTPPPFCMSPVRAVCGIALHMWPAESAAFHDSYQKGLGLTAESPAHHLRNLCLNTDTLGTKSRHVIFSYAADSLEYHINRRPMTSPKATGTGNKWLRDCLPQKFEALRSILKLV